jgi:hypothetical protein
MDLAKESDEMQAYISKTLTQRQNDFDFIASNGDFAYEIEDDSGRKGDAYFDFMSKATRLIPYILSPGNHENADKG